MPSRPAANFDPLARCYAPLERLSFGSALSRRRTRFLGDPRLAGTTHALVLGDGDGRFTAALLERYPSLRVTALDSSAAMLAALERRVALRTPRARLELHCADIRTWLPPRAGYDLVATHFFFDCFTSDEVQAMVERIGPALAPNALWLVSDFAIPPRGVASLLARLLVSALYFAFRILTGLTVSSLPRYTSALNAAGFSCQDEEAALGGALRAELWAR